MNTVLDYKPRLPRYAAQATSGLVFELYRWEPGAGSSQQRQQIRGARLLEVSRGGVRFEIDRELHEGTDVEVTLAMGGAYQYTQQAVIRWCAASGETFHCGAAFRELLPWEVLGELILRGHVSTD
ncbi:MAG: hypothetical protein KatS3mg110_2803 [Pirellulaceae bacterium]|nr:MAG: hypothetical protein KatS3mg110_2803 [Pirellulaceae bacterium]